MKKKILTAIAAFTAMISTSQVVINEYSCANQSLTDNFGASPDWVELYNKGVTSANLGGYYMSDVATNNTKWAIPAGTTIAAGGFLRIWFSGQDTLVGANLHAKLNLKQCRPDVIIFANGSGGILDSVHLRRNQATHSWGRSPDGTTTWKIYTTPTPGATNSGTSFTHYALKATTSLAPGYYPGTINVSINSSEPNDSVVYTINGFDPILSSNPYTVPITCTTTTVLRIRVFSKSASVLPSFIETNTYFINQNFTLPVVSVCGDQLLTLLNGNSGTIAATTLEYFERNKSFIYETSGTTNKHGNDSWAYNQRGIDFQADDELGYNYTNPHQFFTDVKLGASPRTEFDNIILKAGASDNYPGSGLPSCHMRDAFVQSYAFRKSLDLDGRRTLSVIVFANGQYWGVYELREKFDTDYTNFYYNQPKGEIDNLKYWGGINIQDGSDTGWVNIYNYVIGNNMGVPANYTHVNNFLSINSLIDYMVYNSYVMNTDFLDWNSAWWRGRNPNGQHKKWRYWMWDMDNTYNLGQNYSNVSTTGPTLPPCDYGSLPYGNDPYEGHGTMLAKLVAENDTVKSMYINRYAGLINTALNCDSILEHFSYYKGIIAPEMNKHTAKWGGSVAGWDSNIYFMDSMITMRCQFIDSAIQNCYNVRPFPLNVDVQPPNSGWVNVASVVPSYYPWMGTYYASVFMNFNAIPANNYVFDHWTFQSRPIPGGNASADTLTNYTFDTTEFVVAYFRLKEPYETVGTVIVPTGFSPNADGLNDQLYPYGTLYATNFEFEVFNRWGQKVFTTTDKTKGWDGTFAGGQAPVGVYAYRVKALVEGKNVETHGNVTLIR